MKYGGKRDTTLNIPHSMTFYPATFHVVSRKIGYFWDSVRTYNKNTSRAGSFRIIDSVQASNTRK